MTISNQIISFKLSGINYTGSSLQLNYTSGVTIGIATASKAMVLDANKNISGIENLSSNILTANNFVGTISTASQTNITSLGNLTSLVVDGNCNISAHNGLNSGLSLGGVLILATASQINTLYNVTPGTASASKALILDNSRMINNIVSLTSSTINTTNLILGGVSVSASAGQLNYNNISTPGIAENSKALILNSSGSISGINTISLSSITATNLTGTLLTASQPNITSLGSLTGLSISGNISNLVNLTMTGVLSGANTVSASTLTGTLSTPAQTNITSLGTLTGLVVNGNLQTNSLSTTNFSIGNVSVTATSNELNTLSGVTAGTASASKSLIVDNSRNISNINTLTATTLTGTLSTASQSNITSLGSLTGLSVNGNIGINISNPTSLIHINRNVTTLANYLRWSNSTNIGELSIDDSGNIGVGSNTNSSLYFYTNNVTNMFISKTGNVGIGLNTPSYKLDINGSLNCTSLNIGGSQITATASELNYISGVTEGSVTSSKAIITDSSRNISNINTLTATTIAGTMSTAAQPNITSLGTVNGINSSNSINITSAVTNGSNMNIINSSINSTLNVNVNSSTGVQQIGSNTNHDFGIITNATRRITVKNSGNVGINILSPNYNLDVNGSLNCTSLNIGSVAITSTPAEINLLSGINSTVQPSKVVLADANRNINTSGTVSATTLTGTLSTAAQPNITSVGTLTSISTSGAITGVTNMTMSGTISGGNSISATNLTGTITTAAQPNITSVGTLTSISTSGKIKIGSAGDVQDYIHIEDNVTGTLGIQIENRNILDDTGTHIKFNGYNSTNSNYDLGMIRLGVTSSGNSNYSYGYLAFHTRDNSASTLSTEKMRITYNGNVGIGMTTPSYLLEVNGNARIVNSLLLGTSTDTSSNRVLSCVKSMTANSNMYINFGQGLSSNNQTELGFTFISSGSGSNYASLGLWGASSRINISGGGNIGIGGATPNSSYSLYNTSSLNYGYVHQKGTCVSYLGNDGTVGIIGTDTSNSLMLKVNNTSRMFINTSGSVGMGTDTPICKLDLGATASDRVIGLFTSNDFYGFGANNLSTLYSTRSNHVFYVNSTTSSLGNEIARINGTGLGVNTSSPAFTLDVNGTGRINTVLVGNTTSGDNLIRFWGLDGDNSSNRDHTVIGERLYNGFDNSELFLFKGNDSTDRIRLRAGTISFQTCGATNELYPGSDNNTRLFISNDGLVGINTTDPVFTLSVRNGSSTGQIHTQDAVYVSNNSSDKVRYMGNWGRSDYWGIGSDSTNGITAVRIGICNGSGSWIGSATVNTGSMYVTATSSYTVNAYGPIGYNGVAFFGGAQSSQTQQFAAIFNGRIGVIGEIDVISDVRTKHSINNLDSDYCKDFIFKTEPVSFKYKSEGENAKTHLGYIAQDIYKSGYGNLINLLPNDEVEEVIEDDFISPKGSVFSISTNEIIPILAKNIKILYEENEKLKKQIEEILQLLKK